MCGPLGATVCTLAQNEWTPSLPSYWVAPGGEQAAALGTVPFHAREMVAAFRLSMESSVWRDAASHFCGKGLEEGPPDLSPLRAAAAQLRRRKQWLELSALPPSSIVHSLPQINH